MLTFDFFAQNFHFIVNLLAGLISFAIFWLYFDAWLEKRGFKETLKWLGFLLISLSFIFQATVIESTLGAPLLGQVPDFIGVLLRLAGYGVVIYGQIIDPLQPIPNTPGLVKMQESKAFVGAVFGISLAALKIFLPLGALICGLLYLRRATTGLERHLKPIAFAFLLLAASELVSLASLFRGSDNVIFFNLVASFGPLWILEQVLLLSSMVVFARWVWQYLVTRLLSQLFMLFTTSILVIFLITTVTFTFLLLGNIQKEALDNLEVAGRVLDLAVTSRKAETAASAASISQSSDLANFIAVGDRSKVQSFVSKFFENKTTSTIVVTDDAGQVLARAEDPERWGDSVSDDPLVKRALLGFAGSSLSARSSVLAPELLIASTSPVRGSNGNIIGSVTVGTAASNAFVDSVKKATGLDSAVYAGNTRSATTFVAPDGHSRWVGVKEETERIKNTVLKDGHTFQGSFTVLNQPYLGVYAPLSDIDNSVVGMLFIGRTQTSILRAAGSSVNLTFLVAVILLVISIGPAFLVAKYIERQLK